LFLIEISLLPPILTMMHLCFTCTRRLCSEARKFPNTVRLHYAIYRLNLCRGVSLV